RITRVVVGRGVVDHSCRVALADHSLDELLESRGVDREGRGADDDQLVDAVLVRRKVSAEEVLGLLRLGVPGYMPIRRQVSRQEDDHEHERHDDRASPYAKGAPGMTACGASKSLRQTHL